MQAANFALYLLSLVTCLACTLLLWRSYTSNGLRLLLWSALCFVGLTVSNLLLFFDFMLPDVDLRFWRVATALVGLSFLLYGFIFESE